MTEQTTQAVVDEAKAPAVPVAEVDSAREDGADLETLLAQFDQETTKPAPVSPPAPSVAAPDPKDGLLQAVYNRFVQEDINKAVEAVTGDTKAPRRLAEGFLHQLANSTPAFKRAFENRENDPQKWQQVLSAAGKEFRKDWTSRPDQNATEDRAAVVQAVRGASTNVAPSDPAPDFGRMTDQEFAEYKRKNFGF